jgi:hypothetical protein
MVANAEALLQVEEEFSRTRSCTERCIRPLQAGMRRVAMGVQRMRNLPAWLRMAAMVAAVSAVVPWDALAHGKREHDSAAKTNFARHPAKHEPVAQTHPRRGSTWKGGTPLATATCPVGHQTR